MVFLARDWYAHVFLYGNIAAVGREDLHFRIVSSLCVYVCVAVCGCVCVAVSLFAFV